MAERLSDRLREFLKTCEGREVNLNYLRSELKLDPNEPAWDGLRQYMRNLTDEKIVKPSGRHDGTYKVIKQIKPVRVFIPGRERRPIFDLKFPRDYHTTEEMDFAEAITIREGDMVTLGGVKSKGKTALCLNFCAENIDKHPVLMGNEYTSLVKGAHEPTPRFLNRLDEMSEWVEWVDEDGYDKFTLLPVRDDYAEHIVADRINIIDWINLDANSLYDISKVIESIKSGLGKGIGIVALQKGEGVNNARGGQFVRDFSDVELLLDSFGDNEDNVLLTVRGAKEKHKPIVGKTYAYTLTHSGTRIVDFREVKRCTACYGKGYNTRGTCDSCQGTGYNNKA